MDFTVDAMDFFSAAGAAAAPAGAGPTGFAPLLPCCDVPLLGTGACVVFAVACEQAPRMSAINGTRIDMMLAFIHNLDRGNASGPVRRGIGRALQYWSGQPGAP